MSGNKDEGILRLTMAAWKERLVVFKWLKSFAFEHPAPFGADSVCCGCIALFSSRVFDLRLVACVAHRSTHVCCVQALPRAPFRYPELSRFTFHVDNDDDDVSEHELEAQMGGRL